MTESAASPARRGRRVQAWRFGLLALLVALALLLLFWDWNWLKAPVQQRVSAATGREFRIEGDLDVDLGRVVVVRAGDLWLANTGWSLTPEMAKADLLRVEVPLWPLLTGQRTLRRVDVVRPALLLERNRKGTANWKFRADEPARTPGPSWSLGELRVHDGRLDVRDLPLDTHLRLVVDSAAPEPRAESVRLLVRGSGRYRGHPFQLDGWADSPVALLERADAAYRLDFSARAGATRGRVHGALAVPIDPARFQVALELRGNDLGDLYPLVGLALPETPPYSVEGRFARDGRVFSFRDVDGRVGDSDVAGDLTVDLRGERPRLRADLVSTHLDLDDLGVTIGLPPDTGEGESASPEQEAEAREREARARVLPEETFDLAKLGAMDADVQMRADDVNAGKWPVESLALRLNLRDGVLRLDPLQAGVAGGAVAGTIALDASRDPIAMDAELQVRSVDLERAFPNMQPPNVGSVHGRVDLAGQGNSVAAMLATASGEVQLGMGKGRFSNLLLELAGLDVAESLKFLIGKDKTVALRCAYGDFEVTEGVVDTRSLVFDTSDTVLYGEGRVNLAEESLALELKPEPKDVSPVSLRGPLVVGGTFKDPTFRPQAKSLLARAAVAAALYAITPPAALLALIETGPGEDVDCFRGGKGKGGKKRDAGKVRDEVEADEKRSANKSPRRED